MSVACIVSSASATDYRVGFTFPGNIANRVLGEQGNEATIQVGFGRDGPDRLDAGLENRRPSMACYDSGALRYLGPWQTLSNPTP
jgi:hypothetical protein